jgi:chromosome segregation ATPase
MRTSGIQALAPSADIGLMEDANFDDLRAELASLQAEEARLSATRERLQHQIDFGFASGTSREREREVSDQRRELHARIDALRKRLVAGQSA